MFQRTVSWVWKVLRKEERDGSPPPTFKGSYSLKALPLQLQHSLTRIQEGTNHPKISSSVVR